MRLSRTALALGLACSFPCAILASGPSERNGAAKTEALSSAAAEPLAEVPVEVASDAPVEEFASSCDSSLGESDCDSLCGCQSQSRFKREQWHLLPHSPYGLNIGGFTSIGYHTDGIGSTINVLPNRVHLEQQWFYAEKVADGRNGLGLGGRVDYVYGSQGQFLQPIGLGTNSWDSSFDNGFPYGHAIPQAYGEAAYGDLSVKIGYFLKIIGYETVQANGNFFYSRQLSFVNMPITHTGALTEYRVTEDTKLFNGYVLGLSTAFEDGGDAYIGGISHNLNDCVNITYTTTLGRLYHNLGGSVGEHTGQMHSLILANRLTERVQLVNETSYIRFVFEDDSSGDIFANTSYLFYDLTERIALGSRTEFFHVNDVFSDSSDTLTQTLGVNYKPSPNLIFRPEVRWVIDPASSGLLFDGSTSNAVFGMDAIFVF